MSAVRETVTTEQEEKPQFIILKRPLEGRDKTLSRCKRRSHLFVTTMNAPEEGCDLRPQGSRDVLPRTTSHRGHDTTPLPQPTPPRAKLLQNIGHKL